MSFQKLIRILLVLLLIAVVVLLYLQNTNRFDLPEGETIPLEDFTLPQGDTEIVEDNSVTEGVEEAPQEEVAGDSAIALPTSRRSLFVTEGVTHSIPLDEILAGGPPKDGIPAINDPKFNSIDKADVLYENSDVGIGVVWEGEARFYPYEIMVWHEIVNDTIKGDPILVTYCPLCQTGVVFERRVNGEAQEFGVSGLLWQSNLLMYNKAEEEDDESLWSQVLGEAVLGINTGERLNVIPSDTSRYEDWKKAHPNTKILSRSTGVVRDYGRDPYGDYYTSEAQYFATSHSSDELHPKAFVLGVELNGQYKAYDVTAIPEGESTDTFAGETITLRKNDLGVRLFIEEKEVPYISGFWFSWVAVHPETEVYK